MPLYQRIEKMRHAAQTMTLVFAIVLLATGGALSVKAEWARGYDKDAIVIPADETQYYATSMLNLVSGILYAVTAIGLYALTPWGKKLNIISCAVYVVGTLLVEIIELDKGNAMESLADVTFWSALPIIQLTLMLVASSQPESAEPEAPEPPEEEASES